MTAVEPGEAMWTPPCAVPWDGPRTPTAKLSVVKPDSDVPPLQSRCLLLLKVQYLKKYFISNTDTALDVAVKTTTPERHMAGKCVGM